MGNIVLKDEIFGKIKETCLALFDEKKTDLYEMAAQLMDIREIPMHYPYHHYIVPAVLLTACHTAAGGERGELVKMLDTAEQRARNILGGFCGFYGACGAGVGVGIFYSIFQGVSPLSQEGWAAANQATADALAAIAGVEGPRCCKRCCFLALYSARKTIEEKLGIRLSMPEQIRCRYSDRNLDCRKEACPFYTKGA